MSINAFVSVSILAASAALAQQPDPTAAPSGTGQAAVAGVTDSPAADPKAERAARAAAERAQRQQAADERRKMADLRRKYGEGPYPEEIAAYLADKPAPLQPLYKALFTGGERNAVLQFERLGLAAMEQGYWKDAETAFDGALDRIEAVYADNKQAEAARSVFHNEANKDFKGEPYERAMAYYYRGLLYLRAGDYDNARAAFKSAEYQDTVSETETFRNDFAVMNYLTGWTYHCQASATSAAEAFAAAQAAQPALTPPGDGDTVLLIAETGRGPVKARDGAQSEKLVFQASAGDGTTAASFDLGKSPLLPTIEASSVYQQATTRGGRAIDGILAGKASFKETTGTIGDVAMTTSLMQSYSGNTGAASGFAAAGMLFSLLSSSAKTQADIRAWDSLPDRILVASAGGAKVPLAVKVRFQAGDAPQVEPAAAMMEANSGKCGIAWSRSQSSADIAPEVPGEDAGVAAALARKPKVQAKDKAFRTALIGAQTKSQLAAGGGS